MYRLIELGILVKLKPEQASRLILGACRKHGGNMRKAAKQLGVSYRSMKRWVAALDLRDAILAQRAA